MVCDSGAEALLTGFCGPKAFSVLNVVKIKVANEITGTVRDAVKTFKEGTVSFADTANVEGQW